MEFNEMPKSTRILARVIFVVLMTAVGLVVMPGIPPTSDFKPYTNTPAIKLEGKYQPQFVLDKAVKLTDGQFTGAESIVVSGDSIYFGTNGGRVVKLNQKLRKNGKPDYTVVARYEVPCEEGESRQCGRAQPVGIRFDKKGNLVLVDGAYGILSINPITGHVKHRLSMHTPIEGFVPGYPDDLDIAKDGSIFWSDMFTSEDHTYSDIEALNGRLIKTDAKAKEHTVLINGIAGANGVQLSPNEEFVLVAESFKSRLLRYYLKGPKAGSSDVFLDGLPGFPDNIRSNGRGGFIVAVFYPRSFVIDGLGQYPQIRKLLGRLRTLILPILGLLSQIGLENRHLNNLIEFISYFGIDMAAQPIILDIDASGNIDRVLTTKENHELVQVTQITIGDKYVFLGGFSTKQIWKIAIDDLNKNP